MFKLLFTVAFSLSLGACADFERLSMPDQAAPTFAGLRAGAKALVCGISVAASLAGRVEDAVGAGDAAVSTTGQVYVASAIVCGALGGVVTGTATVR